MPEERRIELIDGVIYDVASPTFMHQRISASILLCSWGINGAPDFALEIISRASRRKDYITKLQKYADAGVREYWILDPEKKSLTTYDFSGEGIPHIYPLQGSVGMALYGGELQIDLDELAGKILD